MKVTFFKTIELVLSAEADIEEGTEAEMNEKCGAIVDSLTFKEISKEDLDTWWAISD